MTSHRACKFVSPRWSVSVTVSIILCNYFFCWPRHQVSANLFFGDLSRPPHSSYAPFLHRIATRSIARHGRRLEAPKRVSLVFSHFPWGRGIFGFSPLAHTEFTFFSGDLRSSFPREKNWRLLTIDGVGGENATD